MTIEFELSNQIIHRKDSNIVAASSKNYLRAKFIPLTHDWVAPITAVFNCYTVVLDQDYTCLVPWEVLAEPSTVTVSAFCGDLHTATVATFRVHPSGYTDGQTPEPPTPSVYAQLTQMVQTALDTVGVATEEAAASAATAFGKAQEATAAAEMATSKAEEAAASAASAKASSANAAASQEAAAASASTASSKAGEASTAAETATGKATEAASSATAAKASETNAAESANSAAQSALRAEEIADTVPQIDDSIVSAVKPWSSQKIVNTVCPPFEITAPVAICSPVAGSALHVMSQIAPVQNGEGDPSPENVRPITGWTGMNLWHSGKNLISSLKKGYYGTDFKLYEPTSTIYVSFSEPLHAGKYTISFSKNVSLIRYFTAKKKASATTSILETDPIDTNLAVINLDEDDILYISFRLSSNVPWDGTVQMEYGNKTSPYEPYKGHVVTLEFGQTVYGGMLDVVTGVLTVTHDNIGSYNGETLSGTWISDRDVYAPGAKPTIGAQVVYALDAPQTTQLTPTEIKALSGENTLYTDTGDTTVSGLADPIQVIQKLTERIAALDSEATNI